MGSKLLLALGTVEVKAHPWEDWFYVVAPFIFYLAIVGVCLIFGKTEHKTFFRATFGRISNSLERATGRPGWSMAGALSGLLVLLVAAMGLYWDVAWHIDLGRDKMLLNPSHMMIVLGLGGLMYAAAIAVLFATNDGAKVGLRWKNMTVPWTAIGLFALGAGGLFSFPFDDMWHRAYGLDVTLWSPTHLQLLFGGGIATVPIWMMIAEGRRSRPDLEPTGLGRFIQVMAAGAALTGVTIFQGEFDFRVPQFQMAYYPVLVMMGAGFALVWARLAMGKWGALKAVLFYLGVRGFLYLIVTVALNHTFAHFPTYIVPALLVEGAAVMVGTKNRIKFAVVSGALIGTVGLAAELIWLPISGWYPVSPTLLPKAFALGLPVAIAMSLVGARMGRVFTVEEPGVRNVTWKYLAASAVVVVIALGVPLPRQVGDVTATIALDKAADGQTAMATVTLDPPDAAKDAQLFGIGSNQGGGKISAALIEKAPGVYESSEPFPIVGKWKTSVGLFRGNEVMVAPIYLPADAAIDAPETPALDVRTEKFVVITDVTLRETHDGPLWPSIVAYSEVVLCLILWIALIGLAERRLHENRVDTIKPSGAPTGAVGYSRV